MKTQWHQHRLFKPGYGEFPYLILKVGHALYMQIPIHFLKEGEEVDVKKHPGTQVRNVKEKVLKESRESQIFLLQDEILATTEFVLSKIQSTKPEKNLEACLVLGQKRALYFRDGRFTPQVYIPTGGALLDQMGNIIGMNVEHYTPYEVTKEISDHEI